MTVVDEGDDHIEADEVVGDECAAKGSVTGDECAAKGSVTGEEIRGGVVMKDDTSVDEAEMVKL